MARINSIVAPSALVFIVDPQSSDYANLVSSEEAACLAFDRFPRGADALRAAEAAPPDLWIINVWLADMSGFDLVRVLKADPRRADIFLVTDDYSQDDEVRALSLGVALFACKPPCAGWLRDWRHMPAALDAKHAH